MKRIVAVLLAVIIFSMPAGILSAGELSLSQCIDIAQKNNSDVRVAKEKMKQASGVKQEAFAGYLPKINMMSYASQKNDLGIDISKMGLPREFTAMLASRAYDFQFSLQQPVFTWGKIICANESANLGYKMAKESYRKAKNDLVFNVKKAYYGVLLTKKMAAIAEEMVAVTEAHFKVTESFYNQGKISDYDVSKVKVQMINAKTGLLTIRNAEHLAIEGLYNIIGCGLEEGTVFTSDMKYEPVNADYEAFLKEAMVSRPEIELLSLQKNMSKVLLSMSRANNKPSLIFMGYVDWIQGVTDFNDISLNINDWYRTWNARLILNYSLFDGFSTRAKVLQSKAQLKQSSITEDQLKNGIKMEIRQICFSLKQLQEIISGQKENVEVARENLKIAQERYAEGLVSDVEVRDAQLALNQAGKDYYQALNDYNVSLASLDKATGK